MPEGKFCNRRPINTEEDLKALLGDKGGQQYYKEMEMLEVDTVALWETLQKTCKSRTRTWLEICAHCGLCANSCFLYTANNRDPKQVPSYKIQSTLGEMLRRKGQVDTKFMIDTMEVAWAKCTCCNRCGTYCPHGIDMGVMFSYLRGVLYSQGFVPWELKIGAGMHRVYGAQMDVTTEDWVDTCEMDGPRENAEEWPGLEIPIDKEDCDVMYILNAREPKHYPEDVAQAAIEQVDGIYLSFGADAHVEGLGGKEQLADIRRRAIKAGLKLVDCPIRHLGTERARDLYARIEEHLVASGVELRFSTTCTQVLIQDGTCVGVALEGPDGASELRARHTVVATGRRGADWFERMCREHAIAHAPGPVDIGVRVEVRNEVMETVNDVLYESKLIGYPRPFKNKVRTFCQNPRRLRQPGEL